jgi:hypothetical protein
VVAAPVTSATGAPGASHAATRQRLCASASTIARPMPPAAPVTITRRPLGVVLAGIITTVRASQPASDAPSGAAGCRTGPCTSTVPGQPCGVITDVEQMILRTLQPAAEQGRKPQAAILAASTGVVLTFIAQPAAKSTSRCRTTFEMRSSTGSRPRESRTTHRSATVRWPRPQSQSVQRSPKTAQRWREGLHAARAGAGDYDDAVGQSVVHSALLVASGVSGWTLGWLVAVALTG